MIPADAAEQMSSLKALTDTENLTRPLTVSEAARILGVDRSYAETEPRDTCPLFCLILAS